MDIHPNRGMPGMPQIPTQLPTLLIMIGAAMAGLGVLLLVNPQLLVWLVAGVFLVLGGLFLLVGLRAKKMLG